MLRAKLRVVGYYV